MTFTVREIFGPTVQGEGGMTGRVTHFVRLSGCNMWDGRPATRAASQCPFCDTDFFKGRKMSADEIHTSLIDLTEQRDVAWVTISGGEPMLQIVKDEVNLIGHLKLHGWMVAVETNGTVAFGDISPNLTTCSPKVPAEELSIEPTKADVLKVVWPHPRGEEMEPEQFAHYFRTEERWLQPIQPVSLTQEDWQRNIDICLDYIYKNPHWRLSAQVHKYIGVA